MKLSQGELIVIVYVSVFLANMLVIIAACLGINPVMSMMWPVTLLAVIADAVALICLIVNYRKCVDYGDFL